MTWLMMNNEDVETMPIQLSREAYESALLKAGAKML